MPPLLEVARQVIFYKFGCMGAADVLIGTLIVPHMLI